MSDAEVPAKIQEALQLLADFERSVAALKAHMDRLEQKDKEEEEADNEKEDEDEGEDQYVQLASGSRRNYYSDSEEE
jgi:hypothetical protein